MKRRRFIKLALAALAAPFIPKAAHTIVQPEETVDYLVDWQIVKGEIQITGVKTPEDPLYEEHLRLHQQIWQHKNGSQIIFREVDI